MRQRKGLRESWRASRHGKVLGLAFALALKVVMKSLDLILRAVESYKSILRRKLK